MDRQNDHDTFCQTYIIMIYFFQHFIINDKTVYTGLLHGHTCITLDGDMKMRYLEGMEFEPLSPQQLKDNWIT